MRVKLSAYFLAYKKCSVSFVFHCCHKGHSVIDDNPFWTVCNLLGQIFFFFLTRSIYAMLASFLSMEPGYWESHRKMSGVLGSTWDLSSAHGWQLNVTGCQETRRLNTSWDPGNNFGTRNGGSICWHFLTSFPDKTAYLSSGLLRWWDDGKELCTGQS